MLFLETEIENWCDLETKKNDVLWQCCDSKQRKMAVVRYKAKK